MTELLTTKEIETMLQVDRTTIYRMADSGRIPAIKVGNQWRFPKDQVEVWLQRKSDPAPQRPVSSQFVLDTAADELFPLACVQLIQDSFADALEVMILLTDLQGNLITEPSNPCGLYTAVQAVPSANQRCLDLWLRLASDPALAPRFQRSHLGLLCARGLVRVGSEIKAMLVLGGIAPHDWPPDQGELQRISESLGVDPGLIHRHAEDVHQLDAEGQARVLLFVQRIADIFSHIAAERHELSGRLQRIAEITRMK